MTLRVADWTARGLAVGWLGTIVTGLVLPGGHPPLVFDVGYAVIVASLVLAPIGIGAAAIEVFRARRHAAGVPRRTLVILGLNALFLLVALALTGLFFYAATRR
jgi:uncharacterized membrane protein